MGFLDHEGGAAFPFCKEDVFEALVKAISTINGITANKIDRLSGHILAKAGVSLFSWGENIPISVMEVSPGLTRVSIISTPKTGIMFGGAFDLGKNRRNIENILEIASKILSLKPSVNTKNNLHETGNHMDHISSLESSYKLFQNEIITEEEYGNRKFELIKNLSNNVFGKNVDEFLENLLPLLEKGVLSKDELKQIKEDLMFQPAKTIQDYIFSEQETQLIYENLPSEKLAILKNQVANGLTSDQKFDMSLIRETVKDIIRRDESYRQFM
jgi:hypothetical protein